MQNTDERLILTAEVKKNKIAKTSKIYLNKFARYFGLQYKPSSGAERKKSVKPKRIITNKALKFKMSDNDWLLGLITSAKYVIGVLRYVYLYQKDVMFWL